MARSWIRVALLAGWLGMTVPVLAQSPPAGGAGSAPGTPPPAAAAPLGTDAGALPADAGAMPVPSPGPTWGYPHPDGPVGVPEYLPPNSWSPPPPAGVRPHHLYLSGEYLYWWVKKRQIPPLVSRGQLEDFVPGGEGYTGTQPFLGPGSADDSDQSGGRVTALLWFDDDHTCGIDGSFFGLEQRTFFLSAGSPGFANDLALARPFLNINTHTADADPLALPGIQGGALIVALPRRFYGADFNLRFAQEVSALTWYRCTFLLGGRFMSLDEKMQISEGIIEHTGEGLEGNVYALHDNFTTYNRFYGGQIGGEVELRFGPVVLTTAVKVAVGNTVQTLQISGDTLAFETPTRTLTLDPSRGFLAQPTNVGRHRRHDVGVIPEATLTLAWDFNTYVRAWVGYNFLWWSDVLRPGDQVDTTLNLQPLHAPGLLGGLARPRPLMTSTDFWAQGLTFGVQVSY